MQRPKSPTTHSLFHRSFPFPKLLAVLAAAAAFGAGHDCHAQLVLQPLTEATSKDTKIYQHVDTSNFSSNLSITSPDTGGHFASLVQFDLSSVSFPAADITSAKLTLYSTGIGVSGTTNAAGGLVTLSPILDNWRENAADAGSAPLATYAAFFGTTPTLHSGPVASSQNVTGTGFYDWDITNLVKSWVDSSQPNYGVLIQINTTSGDVGFADVDSTPGVSGSSPALTINTVPEPASAALLLAGLGMTLARRRRVAAC